MTDADEVCGAGHIGRWVVTCNHASNRVPDDVCSGDLGLSAADKARHIACDIGAEDVARAMGMLGCFVPAIHGWPTRYWPASDWKMTYVSAMMSRKRDTYRAKRWISTGCGTGGPDVLLEVRSDQIETSEDQRNWGHRLAQLLDETVTSAEV